MKRIDNSGFSFNFTSKIFEITEEDIEIIVGLLNQELDHHVYDKGNFGETCGEFIGRYDHIQDLILELTKK